MFDKLRKKGFQVEMLHHAEAILQHDMGTAATEIESMLDGLTIPIEELVKGGGGEGAATQRMRKALASQFDWKKHNFEVKRTVDGEELESTSHEIDHVKRFGDHTFALEIEWNNKDPFYDRDLENFKRLHADGVISIGGIITRGTSLQADMRDLFERFAVREKVVSVATLPPYLEPTERQQQLYANAERRHGSFATGWAHAFVSDKFGEATTHWGKLQDRIDRGVGNPCPLLLIGIPSSTVVV